MKRLTKWIDGKAAYRECNGPCGTCDGAMCFDINPMVDRLAAYEDTGLEPEEIAEVQASVEPIPFGRFHDIMEAEREERLVVLPDVKYTDADGEKALQKAMWTCGNTNNPVTRYTADAIAEKLCREKRDETIMSIDEIANKLNQLAYRLDSMRNYQATTEGLKTTKALREAAAMLQSNHNGKTNAILTLDELREMDGEEEQ